MVWTDSFLQLLGFIALTKRLIARQELHPSTCNPYPKHCPTTSRVLVDSSLAASCSRASAMRERRSLP